MARKHRSTGGTRGPSRGRLTLYGAKRRAYRRLRFPFGPPTKVFCIGFNKTGTSSIAAYLSALGLRTCHDTHWSRVRDMQDPVFERFDAFTDGENAPFQALDEAFPGSKFVLNSRGLMPWLISRVKWAQHRSHVGKTGPMRDDLDRLGLEGAVVTWARQRSDYHALVSEYFRDRPGDLLVIDVTTDPDAGGRLLRFLGANPMLAPRFSHTNLGKSDAPPSLEATIARHLLDAGYRPSDLTAV